MKKKLLLTNIGFLLGYGILIPILIEEGQYTLLFISQVLVQFNGWIPYWDEMVIVVINVLIHSAYVGIGLSVISRVYEQKEIRVKIMWEDSRYRRLCKWSPIIYIAVCIISKIADKIGMFIAIVSGAMAIVIDIVPIITISIILILIVRVITSVLEGVLLVILGKFILDETNEMKNIPQQVIKELRDKNILKILGKFIVPLVIGMGIVGGVVAGQMEILEYIEVWMYIMKVVVFTGIGILYTYYWT